MRSIHSYIMRNVTSSFSFSLMTGQGWGRGNAFFCSFCPSSLSCHFPDWLWTKHKKKKSRKRIFNINNPYKVWTTNLMTIRILASIITSSTVNLFFGRLFFLVSYWKKYEIIKLFIFIDNTGTCATYMYTCSNLVLHEIIFRVLTSSCMR